MRKSIAIFGVVSIGAFAAAGSDCLPSGGQACTTMDLPDCVHAGETVVGIRPNCDCLLNGEPFDDIAGSGGEGHFSMSADPGWKILGIDAALGSVSLTSWAGGNAPRTSQPFVVLEESQVGGNFGFAFDQMDASVLEISDDGQLGLTVIWDGPAVVHLRNPQGGIVHRTLDPRGFLPVAMSDDCDTRTLGGTAEHGPLNLAVEVSFTSPGC
jgi:hypothetical protein